MARKSAPAATPAPQAALPRADAITAEGAAAAQAGSAAPDLNLLAEIGEELGISNLLKVPESKPAAETEETTADEAQENVATDAPAEEEESAEAAEDPATDVPEAEKPAKAEETPTVDPLAEIREQLALLKAQNEELRREKPAPVEAAKPIVPLAPIQDRVLLAGSVDELDALAAEFGTLQDRCIEFPDGFEVPALRAGDEPRVISPEEVRSLLVKANRIMREIPVRARELEVQSASDQRAKELFPGYDDPNGLENRVYNQLTSLAPQLRRLPNLRLFIGDAVAHERVRSGAAKKPADLKRGPDGKPLPGAAVVRKLAPPPVPAAPTRAASSAASTSLAQQKALWAKQTKEGGVDNLAMIVESMLPQTKRRSA